MKPLFPKFILAILLVSLSGLTQRSFAQCGTSTTPVMVNFDWQYFDTLPSGTNGFRFMMGKTAMQLKWTGASNTLLTPLGSHTGSAGSFGSGDDLRFLTHTGADTLTFDDELDSVRLSFFDVDNRQVITVRAQDASGTFQNIFLSRVSGTVITITNNGTTTATGTAGNTALANTSTDGTLNIRVPSRVKKVIISCSKGSTGADSLYMSDVTGYLCNSIATWSANYQAASTPEAGQPPYTLVSYNNKIYVVDVTNVTASVLYTDAALTSINSLAYDPVEQVIYYTSNVRSYSNRAIYKYDVKTGTKSTFVSDVLTLGIQVRVVTNAGLGSAAACYYDGALYIATDGNVTVGDAMTVYRIDIDTATGNATKASRFISRRAVNSAVSRVFDWSDFVIKDGVAYCFNQATPSPANFGAYHVDMNQQTNTSGYTTAVRQQMAMDYAENIYHMGNYGQVETYDEAGGFTSLGSYTRSSVADSIITDGAESFKYPYDFSRDTASYGSALHLFNSAQNLILGSAVNYAATNPLDGQVNDNDGPVSFPDITTANSSYSIDVNLTNTTGSAAVLYGYIDFNGDGDFDDPGERSIAGVIAPGATSATITWTGLTGGQVGTTRIRLRLGPSDAEVNTPGGFSSNGEVEDFNINIGMSSLPVELISFTGEKTAKGSVELKWTTASEYNNDYFEVQRSRDYSNWETIGQVKGHGNSNRLLNYTFDDKDPYAGDNYYRLKQVDFDKTYDHSNVILVRFDDAGDKSTVTRQPELTLYPNPTSASFWIRADREFGESGLQQVEVYNLSGDRVYAGELQGSQHEVNLIEQPAGLYLVRVGEQTYKVFKN